MFAQPIALTLLEEHPIEPFSHRRAQNNVLKIDHRLTIVEQSFEIAAWGSKRYGNRWFDATRATRRIDCGTKLIRGVAMALASFGGGNLQGNRIELRVITFGATA